MKIKLELSDEDFEGLHKALDAKRSANHIRIPTLALRNLLLDYSHMLQKIERYDYDVR